MTMAASRTLPAPTLADARYRDVAAWFLKYAKRFVVNHPERRAGLLLKIRHSIRVAAEIEQLARELGLTAGQIQVAKTAAILHDVGRFEQFVTHGTYVDRESLDHGALGARILSRQAVLQPVDPATREMIVWVVRHHNAARLPAAPTETHGCFGRLTRDADKLDIYRVIVDELDHWINVPCDAGQAGLEGAPRVSAPVARAIRAQRIVDSDTVRSVSDLILLRMGWVFDVNFKPALEKIRARGYIEAMAARLPRTRQIQELVEIIRDYVADRTAAAAGCTSDARHGHR